MFKFLLNFETKLIQNTKDVQGEKDNLVIVHDPEIVAGPRHHYCVVVVHRYLALHEEVLRTLQPEKSMYFFVQKVNILESNMLHNL